MAEQDPNATLDETAEDPTAPRPRAGWLVPVLSLAAIVLIGLMWWNGRSAAGQPDPRHTAEPTTAPVAEVQARAPAVQPVATPTPLPPAPTPTPVATQEATSVALPTVTPTIMPGEIPNRAVIFGGNATLRLSLQNDSFASSGRPLDREIEPRIYPLGADATTITDRWCMQLGVVNLDFDVTFDLDPISGTVKTTGTLTLYDGFCDAPGPQRTSATLDLEVPADASAEVVQSFQSDTHLLEVADLLDIDTGVFVELVISNTRPE